MSTTVQYLLKLAAAKTLVVEEVEPEVAEKRLSTCEDCPSKMLNKKSRKCRGCGCYVDIKATSKTNRNLGKLRYEITHCPEGHWDDTKLANQYRLIDGKEQLKIKRHVQS